jgi:crotonobetainyl-CoA:carnitine CoA-transferase CaiB-like acyl-CoA transferase
MEQRLLEGIRVIDLSRIISGPFTTQILAEFGAEVIKVERPPKGDESRGYVRAEVNGTPISPLFATLNSGKRSICIDLQQPAGVGVLLDLIASADVFIHNFRPGVAEKLGIDADTLRTRNHRLVYCAISGFGEMGPLQYKAANDIAGQAYGGLMSVIGEPDSTPVRCPVPVADIVAGYNAAVGILAALQGRTITGQGAVIRTSLLETVVGLMGQYITDFMVTGEPIGRMGSQNRFGQPNQAFKAADGFVVIAAVNERMWQRCAEALGGLELCSDPRFITQQDRVIHQEDLAVAITRLTENVSMKDLIARLEAVGVSCAPINDVEQLTKDEQVEALGMLTTTDYFGVEVPIVSSQVRVDDKRPVRMPVPHLGADTSAVLAQLGYSDKKIAELAAEGLAS